MIDEEWLASFDFTSDSGLHIKGLCGIGSEKIVFSATTNEGKEVAVATYRVSLGFHIREIPLFLSGTPLYKVDRVNRKLLQLCGAVDVDEMTSDYDRLFSSVIRIIYESCTKNGATNESIPMIVAALSIFLCPYDPDALPFLLGTPMMKRRLGELANLTFDPNDPLSQYPQVNGPHFPIRDYGPRIRAWASEMLAFRQISQAAAPLEPETLANNPLFIWGAAVIDHFFTDDELPTAAAFVEEKFGRLPSSARVQILLGQISAIASLMACCLKESELERLMKLCGKLGFMFDVLNRDGERVASSLPAALK